MVTVKISEKGGQTSNYEFEKPDVTIGRMKGNDIVLPKGNVSKKHARLFSRNGNLLIDDLDSTNGTYVNGRKVTSEHEVTENDKIYIGDFILQVQPERESGPPSAPPQPPGGEEPAAGPGGGSGDAPPSPPDSGGGGIGGDSLGDSGGGPDLGGDAGGGGRERGPTRRDSAVSRDRHDTGGPSGGGGGPGGSGGPGGGGGEPGGGGSPSGGGPGGPGGSSAGGGSGPGGGAGPGGAGGSGGGPSVGGGGGSAEPDVPSADDPLSSGGGSAPKQDPSASGGGSAPKSDPSADSSAGRSRTPSGGSRRSEGRDSGRGRRKSGGGSGRDEGSSPGAGRGDSSSPGPARGDSSTPSGGRGDGSSPGPARGDSSTPGGGRGDGSSPGRGSDDSGPGRSSAGDIGGGADEPSGGQRKTKRGPGGRNPQAGGGPAEAPGGSSAPLGGEPSTPRESGIGGEQDFEKPDLGGERPAAEPAVPTELESEFDENFHQSMAEVASALLDRVSAEELPDEYPPRRRTEQDFRDRVEEAFDEVNPRIDRNRAVDLLVAESVGLGPVDEYLDDDQVDKIYVNGYDRIILRRGGDVVRAELGFSHPDLLEAAADRLGGPGDQDGASEATRLSDGTRVHLMLPPVTVDGPVLTIEKPPTRHPSLAELAEDGVMSGPMHAFLERAVETGQSLVVAGPSGSGKRTLLGALGRAIPDGARIVAVEESSQLELPQQGVVRLEPRPNEGYDAAEILESAVSMQPERIILDDCRGAEAYTWVSSSASGTQGNITTLHGTSASDALSRLESLCLLGSGDVSPRGLREQIARAVDLVLVLNRGTGGSFHIQQITEVQGVDLDAFRLNDVFYFETEGGAGGFRPTGYIPMFYEELQHRGMDVDLEIFRE